jgi:hypothetical protein
VSHLIYNDRYKYGKKERQVTFNPQGETHVPQSLRLHRTSNFRSFFPSAIAKMNAAFYTRVFDAGVVEEASRQLHSPFFV